MGLPGLGTLAEIISALNTQLDPLATQHDRLTTYNQLNSILSSPHAAAIGLALSPAVDPATNNPAQPDHVRFFGLKCLEYAVKYQWASLAEDARQATRAGIEALATSGMSATGEPVIIKGKLATVLAEVAKRDWPGVFDLNALLTSMFSLSPTHRELVFMTLTALCEDVYNVDFADEVVLARKRELMKALSSIVLSDEVYTRSVLMRDLTPFRAAVKEVIYIPGEQGRMGWFLVAVNHLQPFAVQAVASKEEVGMAVAAMRALSTMVPWVSSDLMVDANVLTGLAQILSVRGHALQLTYATAEVLFLITQRNYPATGEVELMFSRFVDGGLVAPIVQCLYALDPTDADAFDVMKLLVQALVDVCVRQIAGKANTTGWVPDRLAEYIAAVLELQQHPSVTLSSSILGVWLTALKHERLKKAPSVLEALPRVLEKAVTTFERKPPMDEFPNKKTRERAMASLMSQTKTMVKLVAAMSPSDSAQWLHSQLSSGNHLHGIMTMIEAAAPELCKCPSGLLAIYQNLLARLSTVISTTPGPSAAKDAAVLSHVRTAAACVGAIGSDMQQLLPLIQPVITYSPNDRSIRYHLLAQLAKVALAVPDLVFSLSSDIEAASRTLPMAEVCHVVETQLVAILHTTKLASREQRTAAVRAIFDPLLMGFCSHVDKVLPTPQSLPDICQPANEHHREQRSQVMLPMVALNASLKRAAASSMPDVLDVYVPEVAQRALRVVQCAHAVTDVEWGKRDPVVKMLQGVPHTIKTSYLLSMSCCFLKKG
ncbi:armadillo-type protein [Catenaria anguillulae PL171]|uniref:Armadillo-type protein n=1 Tax=Catenaria anguillulae PL171 TaxID=765915 RepID=A0A1Y2HB92_9FUNG|nr:armadillo-type protein [Catenaria anguillulae PL171]